MVAFVRLPEVATRYSFAVEVCARRLATRLPAQGSSRVAPYARPRPTWIALLSIVAGLLLSAGGTFAEPSCGVEEPCRVDGGSYAIELPPNAPARGVYVFFHGYKGSAALQMEDRRLIAVAHRHGLAFVAPDGEAGTWSHPNAPSASRDEIAFTRAILDDLETRFGFSADRVVIGGFSQGASMAWYAVCFLGDRVAASVTFSGVFWDPLPRPSDCPASPPPMIHFHGRADRTFPLAGRAIGSRWHQGDTFESTAVERERGGCGRETRTETIGGVSCGIAAGCARGSIALCLHDGGHGVDADQLDAALTALGFEG